MENDIRITNKIDLDIATSKVDNIKSMVLYGKNDHVSTKHQNLWELGGEYNFMTIPSKLVIISKHTEDDINGLGARMVLINGLDKNWDVLEEIIPLSGNTTSIPSKSLFIRINSATISSVGTIMGSNFHDILIKSNEEKFNVGIISGNGLPGNHRYGIGRTQIGVMSVPRNKIAACRQLFTNVPSDHHVNVNFFFRSSADNTNSPRIQIFKLQELTGLYDNNLNIYETLPAKTDCWFNVFTSSSYSSLDVRMYYYLVDSEDKNEEEEEEQVIRDSFFKSILNKLKIIY